MRKTLAFVIPAVVVACVVAAQDDQESMPLLWQTDVGTYLESGPSVADLNGDGLYETILAGREEIIALNGAGQELWRWKGPGRFMTYPSVWVREGQSPLLYAGDTSGTLTCLDGAGAVVWQAKLEGRLEWCAAAITRAEPGKPPRVIEGSTTGQVCAFDAQSGDVLWKSAIEGAPANPSLCDLNGDGLEEIAMTTGLGLLYLLNADGSIQWEVPLDSPSQTWATCSPVIFADPSHSARIVTGSSSGRLYCAAADGTLVWTRDLKGPMSSGISAGDIDLDGNTDLFAVTQLGVLYRLDIDGHVRWEIDTQGRSLAAGALVDCNGDGLLEYVLCTQNGHLMVFDDGGEVIAEQHFPHRTINVTPTFADITPASPGLEMVLSGGEFGLALCFATTAPADALMQWSTYRADARKTGAWIGAGASRAPSASSVAAMKKQPLAKRGPSEASMQPLNIENRTLLSGEPLEFEIINRLPAPAEPIATAICIYPDGRRQVARTPLLGEHAKLALDVEPLQAGEYQISWKVESRPGVLLASGSWKTKVIPMSGERSLAEAALNTLQSVADGLPEEQSGTAGALRREAVLLKATLELLPQDLSTLADEQLLAEAAGLVRSSRRALALSEAARIACTPDSDGSLIVSEGDLWESRGVGDLVPAKAANPLELQRRVVPGEHDALSLKLFNTTSRELQVRVQAATESAGVKLRALHSVAVPTAAGNESWDALPPLDNSNVVSVPSRATREVWIDVDFGGASPGDVLVKVDCIALNASTVMHGQAPRNAAPPLVSVQVKYAVLPFQMAPPESMRLCAWASLTADNVEDMLSHGNNVFVLPHGAPQYIEGQEDFSIDFSSLEAKASLLCGRGAFLLLNGVPSLRGEPGSPQRVADLRSILEREEVRLRELGFPRGTYALYPVDEPAGNGWAHVNEVVEFGKLVREIDPTIPIYVNGGGEVPMFEAMAPYTDIWCPALTMLPEETPLMKLVRDSGKTLWTYNCAYTYARPTGPNIKDMHNVAEFRTQALFALRYGATGIGYWSYNLGDDMWSRVEFEYPLVYKGAKEPVTSRRWEAVREGIEDYRICAALQAALEDASVAPIPDALRTRIQALLDTRLPRLVDQCYAEMVRGLGRLMQEQSLNEGSLNAFRAEMLDCVEALATSRSAATVQHE
ncbi:MAG: PQQ-binding-like beta-propeller repeat protein [Candidatus Hydrogenedentes bacterium]|nr:PQQ-binding-like beta-propeller repeat protein [Candidatus Hydrogenedentota bacterium]